MKLDEPVLRWPDPNHTSKVGAIAWPIRPDGSCFVCGVVLDADQLCDCPDIKCGWDGFLGDREAWQSHKCDGRPGGGQEGAGR